MPHVSEPHAQHDPLLVASLAAGELAGTDRDHATALIADCAECAELHADLILIARATAALPPAVAPRDFTITPRQAAALRPVGWRRLVAAMSRSRPLMSRQLGFGLATIGLAGLLVSALPSMQLGGNSAAAPAARPAAGAAVDGSASGGGETSTDTNSGSGGLVGVAGEASSAPPGRLGAVPAASAAASALAAPPQADQSSPAGFGAYIGSKDSSATPGTVAGPIVPGANPTDERALNGTASEQHAFGETSAPSDGDRGLILAGSLVLLWAGIALLIVRQLVRRSVQR
jgi:hypothetical protein